MDEWARFQADIAAAAAVIEKIAPGLLSGEPFAPTPEIRRAMATYNRAVAIAVERRLGNID